MGRLGDWLLEHLPPPLRPTLTAAQVEGYERHFTAAARAGQLVRDVELDLAQLEHERRQQGWTGEYADIPPPHLAQLAMAREELSLAEGARATASFLGRRSEYEAAEQRVAQAREALQEVECQVADAVMAAAVGVEGRDVGHWRAEAARWREEAEQLELDDGRLRPDLCSQSAEPSAEAMAAQDAVEVDFARWREEAEQLDLHDRAVRLELADDIARPSEEVMAAQDAMQSEASTGALMAAELDGIQPVGGVEPE